MAHIAEDYFQVYFVCLAGKQKTKQIDIDSIKNK
jgi:hypothetical protein